MVIVVAIAVVAAVGGCSAADQKSPEQLASEFQAMAREQPHVLSAHASIDNASYSLDADVTIDPAISDAELIALTDTLSTFDVGTLFPWIEEQNIAQHVGGFTHYGPESVKVTLALRANAACLSSEGIAKLVVEVDRPESVLACFDAASKAIADSSYAILGRTITAETPDGRYQIVGSRPNPDQPDIPHELRPDLAIRIWHAIEGACKVSRALVSSEAGPNAEVLLLGVPTTDDEKCANDLARNQDGFEHLSSFGVGVYVS